MDNNKLKIENLVTKIITKYPVMNRMNALDLIQNILIAVQEQKMTPVSNDVEACELNIKDVPMVISDSDLDDFIFELVNDTGSTYSETLR